MNSNAFRAISLSLAFTTLLFVNGPTLIAGGNSATWLTNPGSGDWNTAANWNPAVVPNGNFDTANFGTSNVTAISTSADTTVELAHFNMGASGFTITAGSATTFTLNQIGVQNLSGVVQNFATAVDGIGDAGTIEFRNGATTSSLTDFTNNGGVASGSNAGTTHFFDDSNAGISVFIDYINKGGTVSGASGGSTVFFDMSSAGNAAFFNGPAAVAGASGGVTAFEDNSTGAGGTFINQGAAFPAASGGTTVFEGMSTAETAFIINEASTFATALGGSLQFFDTATAGAATVTNKGAGSVGAHGGTTDFNDMSDAGTANITNEGGGATGSTNGLTTFDDNSSANGATITNNSGTGLFARGGATVFTGSSDAGTSTITNNGGTNAGGGGETAFTSNAKGGSATITNNASDGMMGSTAGDTDFSTAADAQMATITNKGATVALGHGGLTVFQQNATAGSSTITNEGASVSGTDAGGRLFFEAGPATAGSSTIVNNGGTGVSGAGATTHFQDGSLGGSAHITANGGVATSANGGFVFFEDQSSAENATITANGANVAGALGGVVEFVNTADADAAILIANGGTGGSKGAFLFDDDSTGGTSQVRLFGGVLNIGLHNAGSVTIGSLAGDSNGVVLLDANNLTVGSNNLSTNFAGQISGVGGTLTKIGTGTLVLSGTNTYTLDTFVDAGALIVDGSIASPATFVDFPNALLGGNGTIGGNVNSFGIVSPGNGGPGTLTVTGPYGQFSSSTLRIELGGTGAGQHDLLVGGSNVGLDGTLQLLRINNFRPHAGDQIQIITATGTVLGEFATVTDNFGPLLRPTVVYDPNEVFVVFAQGSFVISDDLTPNQLAIAHQLNNVANDPHADDLIGFLDNEPLAALPHEFDLIAPDELASIYEISFSHNIVQNMNLQHRMDDIRAGSTGFCGTAWQPREVGTGKDYSSGKGEMTPTGTVVQPAASDPHWGVFAAGSGEFINVDGDFNAHGYDITTGSFIAGADYRIGNHFAIGIDGGYMGSNADLVDNGEVEVDGGRIGAYATLFGFNIWGSNIHIDGSVGGGWNTYDTHRTGLQNLPVTGSTEGSEFDAMIAYGGDWHFGCLVVGTWSTIQYIDVDIDGFTESGSLAPLHIEGQDEDSFIGTTGVRLAYDWHRGNMIVRPEVRAAWMHESNDRSYPIDAHFASGAGDTFTVHGPKIGRDAALIDAGVAVQWTSRISSYVYYDGVLGRTNYTNSSVSGGFRVSF